MNIVIFGAGQVGRHVIRGLRKMDCEPLCFCEDKRHDIDVDGLAVIPTKEAIRRYLDALYVIALHQPAETIKRLTWLGVEAQSWVQFAFRYPTVLLPYCFLSAFPARITSKEKEAWTIWADEESTKEYANQIVWRHSQGRGYLSPKLDIDDIYFPADLFDLRQDEVFVDCGAYDGDTIRAFRAHGGDGHEIAFEPDQNNYLELHRNFPNIVALRMAVGAKKGRMPFDTGQGVSSSLGKGQEVVDCDALDHLLAGLHPTFIKMDIEGAELDALHGAAKTIKTHKPVLAICLYHKPTDLWEIPLYIRSIAPDYRLYLRRYAEDCWESVLYCIPAERVK
jgi:FkbM family methyltransferase